MTDWTFITNHGAVLISISDNEKITTRELANNLGLTERSVIRIIGDLEFSGYLIKNRMGRSNRYLINRDAKLRHETLRDFAVGDLLAVLSPDSE